MADIYLHSMKNKKILTLNIEYSTTKKRERSRENKQNRFGKNQTDKN